MPKMWHAWGWEEVEVVRCQSSCFLGETHFTGSIQSRHSTLCCQRTPLKPLRGTAYGRTVFCTCAPGNREAMQVICTCMCMVDLDLALSRRAVGRGRHAWPSLRVVRIPYFLQCNLMRRQSVAMHSDKARRPDAGERELYTICMSTYISMTLHSETKQIFAAPRCNVTAAV